MWTQVYEQGRKSLTQLEIAAVLRGKQLCAVKRVLDLVVFTFVKTGSMEVCSLHVLCDCVVLREKLPILSGAMLSEPIEGACGNALLPYAYGLDLEPLPESERCRADAALERINRCLPAGVTHTLISADGRISVWMEHGIELTAAPMKGAEEQWRLVIQDSPEKITHHIVFQNDVFWRENG